MASPALSPPPLDTALVSQGGKPSPTWQSWLSQLQSILAGALHPTTPQVSQQSGAIYQGSGAPSNSYGSDGDFYFRTDAPATPNQRLYVKGSGSWTGIL